MINAAWTTTVNAKAWHETGLTKFYGSGSL